MEVSHIRFRPDQSAETYLAKNHGGNLLRSEGLFLIVDLDLDLGLSTFVDDGEREVLDISLDLLLVELAADHTFLPLY